MYCEHFGLEAFPFKISPDQAFLYEHSQNRRALNMLRSGLAQLSPITVVGGDVGTGKTTLILRSLRDAPDNITLGLLSTYPVWADDILPWVFRTLEIPDGPDDIPRLEVFRGFVEREYAGGRRCVLIVDEAQNVSPRGFDQLRQLANVNRGKDILFHLILVGQIELFETLRLPECAALAQSIGVTIRLGPMTEPETDAYIRHRLTVAGGRPELFDAEATAAVHLVSGGYPRVVNLVCDTAMVLAYGDGDQHIGKKNIRAIGEDHSVLSHLPDLVAKAQEVSGSKSALKPIPVARFDRGETGETYLQGDVFQFSWQGQDTAPGADFPAREEQLVEPEGSSDSHGSFTPRSAPEPDDNPAVRNSDAIMRTGRLRHAPPSPVAETRRDSRSGLRFLLGCAVAASVVVAGVVVLNLVTIVNGERIRGTEVAALEPASVPAALNGISIQPAGASEPLEDMTGDRFLDRALAVGISDPRAAAIDYARAALRGEERAAYYLGQLYETGDGVPLDLARARSWYASVEESVRGARRRLKDLGPPVVTGELAAPTPLLGGTLETGGAEFVWMSGDGADPAYFVIELSDGTSSTVRRLPPQEISALRTGEVGAARFWRVIAVSPQMQSYAASDWARLGASETTLTRRSDEISPQAVVQVPGDAAPEPLSALTNALDASRIPYRVESGGSGRGGATGIRIGYFFEDDAAAARAIAATLGAEVNMMRATAKDRVQPMPVPGEIVILSGQP